MQLHRTCISRPKWQAGAGAGSASAADYLIKRVTESKQQPLRQQRQYDLSKDVLACIEVKGPWQCNLVLDRDIRDMSAKELKDVEPALKQVYGYMVMDEAAYGMAVLGQKHMRVKSMLQKASLKPQDHVCVAAWSNRWSCTLVLAHKMPSWSLSSGAGMALLTRYSLKYRLNL